jgi:4-diphosphocytidyl-2-C-methyl-D-erythritol kinase
MATKPIALISPAKINLFLIVTGKRPDGYHELVTLICPVTLTDTVTVKLMRREITVTCADPNVPEDETNLAHQAARLFLTRWTKEKKGRLFGAHINIEKRIPVAAGLGGGSSNAATVLLGLNRIQGKPYTREELETMSLNLGADVPFFIIRRPAIATGIGEVLQSVTGVLNDYSIILVHPPIRISTANVYQNLNLRLTKCQQRLKNSNLRIKDALARIQPGEIAKYLCNDLETVTATRYPAVEEIKQTLLSLGANGALMSGSGPTVFGLFRDKLVARSAFRHLVNKVSWNVFQVECWSNKNNWVT